MRKYNLLSGRFLFILFGMLMAAGSSKIYIKSAALAKGYRLAELKDQEIALQTERGLLAAKLESMLQRDQLEYLVNAMPTNNKDRRRVAQIKVREW